MSEMLWYDPVDAVRDGKKRHIYEEERGAYIRMCGTNDNTGHARKRTDLKREERRVIRNDPNVCERCLKASGLHHLIPKSNGAESVSYDPFGVMK